MQRPYHGIVLLVKHDVLIRSLPANCNFYVQRLIEMYNPRLSMTRYAAELDVPIAEVCLDAFGLFLVFNDLFSSGKFSKQKIYTIVDHLIYWAKVKIIYPITENNVYVVHSNAPTFV